MLLRAVFFAACALVVALVISQAAPVWVASWHGGGDETLPSEPSIAAVDSRPEPELQGRQVALRTGPGGHATINGRVNNRPVTFLLDTGATMVVLNERTARNLGYHLAKSDFTQVSRTANGDVLVAPIRLSEIRVDNIVVRDVPAIVVPGQVLEGNLLGMSFLNRLRKFEFQGDRLVLTQ